MNPTSTPTNARNIRDISTQAPPFWRDLRVIRVIAQVVFLALIVLLFYWLAQNTLNGLRRLNLLPSFEFLNQQSQFQIDEGLVPQPHRRTDTYANAFLIGLINTLRVAIAGLVLATLLGLVVGLARMSKNYLVRGIATVYIEVMQNTPLLIQLLFLYIGVFLTLPPTREAVTLPGPVFLSIRGLALPALFPTEHFGLWAVAALVFIGVGRYEWLRRRRIRIDTGRMTRGAEVGLLIALGGMALAWLVLSALGRNPLLLSLPRIAGPRYVVGEGVVVTPEYTALVLGLVLYTAAFIGEVVRSGIQAVSFGQWEAARAQGFGYVHTLRLIILPQALRVMIPPLANQYVNLIKNSSLGAAVGFADLFGVANTSVQSGQVVPVIMLTMGLYLTLDLITTAGMNFVNSRVQFKTR
jgi:general L-amino acid transport system permease protein